jgi:hypothetical protein
MNNYKLRLLLSSVPNQKDIFFDNPKESNIAIAGTTNKGPMKK